jgi:hypothetical protein
VKYDEKNDINVKSEKMTKGRIQKKGRKEKDKL